MVRENMGTRGSVATAGHPLDPLHRTHTLSETLAVAAALPDPKLVNAIGSNVSNMVAPAIIIIPGTEYPLVMLLFSDIETFLVFV